MNSIPDRWWTVFGDTQLNHLIDTAISSNFEIKTAWERLQAAEAVVEQEISLQYPYVDARISSAISFPQPDFVGGENVRLGLAADYEVDLWGRIDAQVDAAKYRAAATAMDYHAAVITLSAEITRTWFQLTEAYNQLDIVRLQIETNEKTIESLRNRFRSGQIRAVDILRQQQLLKNTMSQKVTVEERIQLLNQRLAVLLGRQAQRNIGLKPDNLPKTPPLPQTGIPGELVQRRPDVQASYLSLLAADRDLAAAISNKYPRISLSASTSLRANQLDNLWESWAYSFGLNLLAPLFYGGQLQAEVDRTEAVKQQRLFAYGQNVLIAFQEVENALVREARQNERIKILEEQYELSKKTYEQLRIQYFNGTTDYLDVLTALDNQQQLQRELLAARELLLEYRVGLYRALAGSVSEEE